MDRRIIVTHHPAQAGPSEQLEAHHRRHRVSRQPEHRLATNQPERQRLRGPNCDLHPSHRLSAFRRQRVQHHLDEVEIAHAHAAARHDRIARRDTRRNFRANLHLGIPSDAEVNRFRVRLRDECKKRLTIRITDLAKLQRRRWGDQFVASREHPDSHTPVHRHRQQTNARKDAKVARRQRLTRAEHGLPDHDVLPRRANCVAE